MPSRGVRDRSSPGLLARKADLARIIYERFNCNRGFAALACEASFVSRRSYLVVRKH